MNGKRAGFDCFIFFFSQFLVYFVQLTAIGGILVLLECGESFVFFFFLFLFVFAVNNDDSVSVEVLYVNERRCGYDGDTCEHGKCGGKNNKDAFGCEICRGSKGKYGDGGDGGNGKSGEGCGERIVKDHSACFLALVSADHVVFFIAEGEDDAYDCKYRERSDRRERHERTQGVFRGHGLLLDEIVSIHLVNDLTAAQQCGAQDVLAVGFVLFLASGFVFLIGLAGSLFAAVDCDVLLVGQSDVAFADVRAERSGNGSAVVCHDERAAVCGRGRNGCKITGKRYRNDTLFHDRKGGGEIDRGDLLGEFSAEKSEGDVITDAETELVCRGLVDHGAVLVEAALDESALRQNGSAERFDPVGSEKHDIVVIAERFLVSVVGENGFDVGIALDLSDLLCVGSGDMEVKFCACVGALAELRFGNGAYAVRADANQHSDDHHRENDVFKIYFQEIIHNLKPCLS